MTNSEQLQKLKSEYEKLLNSGDIFSKARTDGQTGHSTQWRTLEEIHQEIEYLENLIAKENAPKRVMRIKFYAN